jgi:hypothetical protein
MARAAGVFPPERRGCAASGVVFPVLGVAFRLIFATEWGRIVAMSGDVVAM